MSTLSAETTDVRPLEEIAIRETNHLNTSFRDRPLLFSKECTCPTIVTHPSAKPTGCGLSFRRSTTDLFRDRLEFGIQRASPLVVRARDGTLAVRANHVSWLGIKERVL